MGLINIPDIQNLDAATPELWNSRYAILANLVNGNIDAANLAASAVTSSKIATDAVTTVKIPDANITFAKLLATIFSGQVASYSSGGAAGTFYYINLGGIKLVWGLSNAVSTASGSTAWSITYPSTWFTTVQAVVVSATGMTGFAAQYASVSDVSYGTSQANGYITSTGVGTAKVALLAIGT